MGYTKDQLLSSLQELQISFSKYDHPVVLTVEAQAKYVGHVKAALSKNLFLKDKKQRFYIVSVLADTKVDLKVLSQRLGLGKGGIRMAPEESLADSSGCVTPFALVNESARNVSLLLDQGLKSHDSCIFHPLSNDMSIALNAQDLDKFLHSIGIRPAYVDLKDNPAVGKDQPPDLASLVPSDATVFHAPPQSKASVQVPTENQILSNANTAPVAKVELREVSKLQGHTDRVWSVAFRPGTGGTDGIPSVLASCSGDKTIRIWEQSQNTFICRAVLEDIHTRTVISCAWSPCGNLLATASFDATTAIWEEVIRGDFDFNCVSTLEGHENEIKCVSWNASGTRLATCARDKTVWIWEVEPHNEYENLALLQGHTQDVKMVVWHPNLDILVSSSYDNTIKFWADEEEDDDWTCIQTLNESNNGHTSTVWAVSINASGDKMVSCSDDLTIKIWGAEIREITTDGKAPWTHLCTLSGFHDRTIFSVHWSMDGIIATGAADDAIRLFVESKDGLVDGLTYKILLKKEKAHDMDVNVVQWSSMDHTRLASASDDGTIKVWEFGPQKQLQL